LLACIVLSGCVRREGRNTDCKWPGPAASTATVREDLEFAEELAIEYMDANFGPRSGHFTSQQAAGQALNGCMHKLIEQIGAAHNMPPAEVAKSVGRRSAAEDAAVIMPYLAIYTVLAALLAGWLLRRYPPDSGWTGTLVMLLFASLAVGAVGLLIGEQWSTLAENIRVGTGHLSYRLNRLPWGRNRLAFYLACVALFWCAAIVRYRSTRSR